MVRCEEEREEAKERDDKLAATAMVERWITVIKDGRKQRGKSTVLSGVVFQRRTNLKVFSEVTH